MALPANVNSRTVHGKYLLRNGDPASGTVNISTSVALRNPSEDLIITPGTITVNLDGSGAFSVSLICTDDADMDPVGWTYQFTETIANWSRKYSLPVPIGDGSPIEIADVVPSDESGGIAWTYIPESKIGQPLGVASLDEDGLVPLEQLPEGIGGGGGDLTPGSVTTTYLGADAVTNAKLADNAVQIENMADNSVGTTELADGAVTGVKVASAIKDAAAGTASLRTLGTGSAQAAAGNHGHAIADTTGLQTALDGKAASTHSHTQSQVTGLTVGDVAEFAGVKFDGVGGLGAVRMVGKKATAGSPSSGTWLTGDLIIDSTGVWWLCTAGGSPGTWGFAVPAHASTHYAGGSDVITPENLGTARVLVLNSAASVPGGTPAGTLIVRRP